MRHYFKIPLNQEIDLFLYKFEESFNFDVRSKSGELKETIENIKFIEKDNLYICNEVGIQIPIDYFKQIELILE